MKDAAHHLKHVQRKIIQGARKEQTKIDKSFSGSSNRNMIDEGVEQETIINQHSKNERLRGHPNYH